MTSGILSLNSAQKLGWSAAFLIFAADRLSKLWVLHGLGMLPGDSIPLLPFFSLTFVWNEGISLGLFQQGTDLGRYLLVGITAAISVILVIWLLRAHVRLTALAIGLILGGAIGNIWDRLAYGAVADFAHFYVGSWSFYIFNIADAGISIGVVFLLFDSFSQSRDKAL